MRVVYTLILYVHLVEVVVVLASLINFPEKKKKKRDRRHKTGDPQKNFRANYNFHIFWG